MSFVFTSLSSVDLWSHVKDLMSSISGKTSAFIMELNILDGPQAVICLLLTFSNVGPCPFRHWGTEMYSKNKILWF